VRNFYAMPDRLAGADQPVPHAYERRTLQVVTLAYWAPSCIADLCLLWRGGLAAGGFVFGLLFREALVFLALWFVSAAAQGLMRGSRAPKEPGARQLAKLRARLTQSVKDYVAPTRGNRGQ
jgi:hypothetical protein